MSTLTEQQIKYLFDKGFITRDTDDISTALMEAFDVNELLKNLSNQGFADDDVADILVVLGLSVEV